jgi:light-regulated signal transduction histidine kinase (bacteriophytochrome)
MQLLVKGLLDFSRIGKEKEMSTVNCNTIVDKVIQDLDFSIANSKAIILVDALPTIKAYSVELRLLFQNLISNAIKFRSKDKAPVIEVKAEKQEEGYLFSVRDNGIGIDAPDFDKIFVIFKRLHNRNDYEGTGIGLSHCKKIIEMHGGTIWLESELGKGTVFYFVIPNL